MRRIRLATLGIAAALAAACSLAGPASAAELRGGLDAIVAGQLEQDPKVAQLAGLAPGEIAYFAVLSEPNDAAHAAALVFRGARVLRSYRSVSVFALASTPTVVGTVAAVPWVQWLAPVQLVRVLEDPIPDQSRATTGDIGAPALWSAGLTGAGTRIAVLDTGLDTTHPDLDDLDFRRWSSLLPQPAKVVANRSFVGGVCAPSAGDGHGHGTHVAGIATGTAEGVPAIATDDGLYAGIAPDAQLAVGKVMTDAGAGLNSDLLAALEWAALPAGSGPATCPSVGADVVNLSLGTDARPLRLNSGRDVDLVSLVANRLAVRYGTVIVAAAGNSGPFIGSVLEAPGAAAQVLSVAATAKDYDLNHDDTLSGDTCAGWQPTAAQCAAGTGTQRSSISSFSSRGPTGDLWLRPDLAAPGYNIVAPQASTGLALAQNDLNRNTRTDPLYATATGTSMASPAAAGSAALLLQAYRRVYGSNPVGASGVDGLPARAYALVRAALMNSAGSDLWESRWILTVGLGTTLTCPPDVDLFGFCSLGVSIPNMFAGSLVLYDVRNGAADPYVGPLAEGAGKINSVAARRALVEGVVAYSAASGTGEAAGSGPRDLQGSWQVGVITPGETRSQRFVLHAAPGRGPFATSFRFEAGNPSDGSRAITSPWSVSLSGSGAVPRGGDRLVTLSIRPPLTVQPGIYTGRLVVSISNGQVLRLPVHASVPLRDAELGAGSAGPRSLVTSERDMFAKGETLWPYAGVSGTGSASDWRVYPVEIRPGTANVTFSVWGADPATDTYDLYVYDSALDLLASTHPFVAPDSGVTDVVANAGRGASTSTAPQTLAVTSPPTGLIYVAVSRAKAPSGLFGAFTLRIDERRP